MRILEASKIDLQLADIRSWHRHPEPKLKRSPGVHLSGVLKVMAKEFNLLKDIEPDDWEEEFPLRMVIGMAVERQLAGYYRDLRWQPGEIQRDGIYSTPDGLRRTKKRRWECKYTHKSCRDFDLNAMKNRLWVWQLLGYECTQPTPNHEAELHVVFGNGNYNRPYAEEYWMFVVQFGEEELKRFWNLVLKFKSKAVEESGNGN